jgi:hypothetical protein
MTTEKYFAELTRVLAQKGIRTALPEQGGLWGGWGTEISLPSIGMTLVKGETEVDSEWLGKMRDKANSIEEGE